MTRLLGDVLVHNRDRVQAGGRSLVSWEGRGFGVGASEFQLGSHEKVNLQNPSVTSSTEDSTC